MRKKLLILLAVILIAVVGALVALRYWTHRYDKLIYSVATQHNVDPLLVKAIVYEESFFRSGAHSSQNAIGLMQVTPVVAEELISATHSRSLGEAISGVSGGAHVVTAPSFDEAMRDPATSLHVGCWYLRTLLNRYRDEPNALAVTLAAYNAGPTNVERWAGESERAQLSPDEFLNRIQFPATREYVRRIIERYDDYRQR
ncbi:MAG TPA: lytic transglycosylase domain-containing protein [Blastocatellia bacterium]|nr:lytic transglycosylase domain-containing protein [Blastocatellia bacterium]